MPFPAGTFLNNIRGVVLWVADEFESLYAQFFGYLSTEHNEDGTHGAVTATSITSAGAIAGTTGTFTGNVTADSDGTPVTIGQHALASSNRPGAGIDFRDGTSAHWRIVAFNSGSETRQLEFIDRIDTGATYTFRVFKDSGVYILHPATGVSLHLGDATFGKITAIAATDCSASAGYKARGRTAKEGEWTAVTFAAGNFTASAGAWTVDSGDQAVYGYSLNGLTATVRWTINNTDVSAAATLRLAIPGGYVAAVATEGLFRSRDAGAASIVSSCDVTAGGTYITLYASPAGANYTITAADNTTVSGTFSFEIQP